MNIERNSLHRRGAQALLTPSKLMDWHRHIACYCLAFGVISALYLFPVLENYLTAGNYLELKRSGPSQHPLGVELLGVVIFARSIMYSFIAGVRLKRAGFWLFFMLELSVLLLLIYLDAGFSYAHSEGAKLVGFLLIVRLASQLLFLLFRRFTGLLNPGKLTALAYTTTLALGFLAVVAQLGFYAYFTHKYHALQSVWNNDAIPFFGSYDQLHKRVEDIIAWEKKSQVSEEVSLEKLKYTCPYKTNLRGLFIEEPGVFYAIGGRATILRVDTNRGLSVCDSHFSTSYKGALNDIQFYDGFGIAVGDHAIKYSDNGRENEWHSLLVPRESRKEHILYKHNRYYDAEFISRKKGFLASRDALLVTNDGGQSWHHSNGDLPELLHPRALSFVDENNGWMVGMYGAIFHTSNSGESWRDLSIKQPVHFKSVLFIDEKKGFAGTVKDLRMTLDGGKTWKVVGQGHVFNIDFVDELHGITTTYNWGKTYLTYTQDGGANWSYMNLPGGYEGHWRDAALESQDVGYVVGEGGQVFRFTIH